MFVIITIGAEQMKQVYVSPERHQQLKILACSEGKKMQELVNEIFDDYFKKKQKKNHAGQ